MFNIGDKVKLKNFTKILKNSVDKSICIEENGAYLENARQILTVERFNVDTFVAMEVVRGHNWNYLTKHFEHVIEFKLQGLDCNAIFLDEWNSISKVLDVGPPPIPSLHKVPTCSHKNKRKSHVGMGVNLVTFDYCPDCKKEV